MVFFIIKFSGSYDKEMVESIGVNIFLLYNLKDVAFLLHVFEPFLPIGNPSRLRNKSTSAVSLCMLSVKNILVLSDSNVSKMVRVRGVR